MHFLNVIVVLAAALTATAATITLDGVTTGSAVPKSIPSATLLQVNTSAGTSPKIPYSGYYGTLTYGYENGILVPYLNSRKIPLDFFGGLKQQTLELSFDVAKVGLLGRLENKDKLFQIWDAFRVRHMLNAEGKYVITTTGEPTPSHDLALLEFLHHIAETRPIVTVSTLIKCKSCSGRGAVVGINPINSAVENSPCKECNTFGTIAAVENFRLAYSGTPPTRPQLADLIKAGLVKPKVVVVAPVVAPVVVAKIELTPKQKYANLKGKAEAGDTQSEYEIAHYLSHRVVGANGAVELNYFDAFEYMKKASLKNHRLAQFFLAGYYEKGQGVEKDLQTSLNWFRKSASLGCQRAITAIGTAYLITSYGDTKYAGIIVKDETCKLTAYAWFKYGVTCNFYKRTDFTLPAEDELKAGGEVATTNDYIQESSALDTNRSKVSAVAGSFTKAENEAAKEITVAVSQEAIEFLAKNKYKP